MATKTQDDQELENVLSWMKTEQRCLDETEEALENLKEIAEYGHYTLDVKIGGSTTGPYGNGYQKSKFILDWLDVKDRDKNLKTLQAPLINLLTDYLKKQIAHYQNTIAKHRKRIKELA